MSVPQKLEPLPITSLKVQFILKRNLSVKGSPIDLPAKGMRLNSTYSVTRTALTSREEYMNCEKNVYFLLSFLVKTRLQFNIWQFLLLLQILNFFEVEEIEEVSLEVLGAQLETKLLDFGDERLH